MKRKKFERQQREKAEREKQAKAELINNMKTVTLDPVDNNPIDYDRTYSWECPNHTGSFTYSKKINEMWGHPTDLVFCAVCLEYHKFQFNLPGEETE